MKNIYMNDNFRCFLFFNSENKIWSKVYLHTILGLGLWDIIQSVEMSVKKLEE